MDALTCPFVTLSSRQKSFKILVGRLFGPVDLSLISEDIIKFTSSLLHIIKFTSSVGVINNDSALGWWGKSWNDLFENLILPSVFSAIELK